MKRKFLLTSILALGVVGAVAGCGQSQKANPQPNPPKQQTQPSKGIDPSLNVKVAKTPQDIPSVYPLFNPDGKPDTVKPVVKDNLLMAGTYAFATQMHSVVDSSESKTQAEQSTKILQYNAAAVSFSVDGKNVVAHIAKGFPLFGVKFYVNNQEVKGNSFSAPTVQVSLKCGKDVLQLPLVSNVNGALKGEGYDVSSIQ